MADPNLAARLRNLARIVRGERAVKGAALRALEALLAYASTALRGSGYDTSILDDRAPAFRAALRDGVLPAIEAVFTESFAATARGALSADLYATRHLESVWNRLVAVSDETFDVMRSALAEGRLAGEGIPKLAARVDALLADSERWANRATTIARTEVIGANNAGAYDAARASADFLGVPHSQVARTWLATSDGRTRTTHAEAEGQQVIGLDTPFTVGADMLMYPGDPSGSAEEVINCRCVETIAYPGDPDYPALTAAGGPMNQTVLTAAADDDEQTSVVVVALPAADDPVHSIGAEQKHATLLFFGSLDPEDDMHNPQLETYRSLLDNVLGIVAAETAPFTEDVSGVESLGDDGARVWMLAGDHLPGVRDELLEVDLELVGVLEAVEQYPSYTPHVTIGYPAADPDTAPEGDRVMLDPDTEAQAADVASITFDRLALWWAGEQVEYPLTTQQEAPVETEPTEASAGTVLLARREGDAEADLTATAQAMAEAFGWDFNTAAEALQRALTDPVPSPSPWTLTTTHAPLAPGEAPAGGPGLAQDIPTDGEPFYGILCPEGVLSGDARQFGEGAITWRDLPLPLMYQDATALGHDGAVRVGRIDVIERDESGARPMIRYAGVYDTSDVALEARRQVGELILRGVSVDCDAVTVEYMGSDGQVLDPMVDDFPEDGVVIENATAARIAGATLCSIPAFHQAYQANGTLADRTEPEPGQAEVGTDTQPPQGADESVSEQGPALAASAWLELREQAGDTAAPGWSLTAAAVVAAVPFSDFTRPDVLDTYTDGYPCTIVGDRVYGHLAAWGQCHIGVDGLCQEPPSSMSGYAHYAVGSVLTDQGRVHVGQLTMDTGHAPMHLSHRPAAAHYDNTGAVWADVAMGEDGIGIWYSGRIRPHVTADQRQAIQASGKLSGDWREAVRGSGQLELVAALLVNVHGFSIPRPAIAASGGRLTALVASGIVDRPPLTSLEQDQVSLVRQLTASVMAAITRTNAHADAAARLRRVQALEASRRLERIH